jgi:hypothetical protein
MTSEQYLRADKNQARTAMEEPPSAAMALHRRKSWVTLDH